MDNSNNQICYAERSTGAVQCEKIYGKFFIEAMYGNRFHAKLLSWLLRPLIANVPFFSNWYGRKQKSSRSQKKIKPFIRTFQVDTSEFADPVDSFESFNDFFIRKLKPEARPIAEGEKVATLPADGRYLFFPSIQKAKGFFVKGQKFNLSRLLQDDNLCHQFEEGSMVIGRLCPTDYHRFHFPCDATPTLPKLINGPLYSVNPLALRTNIEILSQNKRMLTKLHTHAFGTVLYIEVGATCVGTIKQTHEPEQSYAKGEEKGYFEFGGSCVILLFEPNTILFDEDLLTLSQKEIEIKGKMGESFARSVLL